MRQAGSRVEWEDDMEWRSKLLGGRARATATIAAIAGGLSLLAGAGFAQSPSEQDILNALTKGHSRAPVASADQQSRDTDERRLIESLLNRKARSITEKDRTNIEEFAKDKPSIDIEVTFDFNSDVIGAQAK